MRALVYHGPKNVSVDEVADAKVERPTDALVKITITRKPNGMLQYSVSGHHDKFPAYELYVNGEAAYQWGTEAQLSEAGPAGLRSSMTIEVDQDKVIKTPPVPLFL